MLKANRVLKNVSLNGTGIHPRAPIFVKVILRRHHKFYGPGAKNFG